MASHDGQHDIAHDLAREVGKIIVGGRLALIPFPYGEEMSPSIKAFGSRDLSLAKCRDYGRDRGSEVRFPPDRSGST